MRGSYHAFILQKSATARDQRLAREQAARAAKALAEEAAERKRARIMNRAEPGYERKDGKL